MQESVDLGLLDRQRILWAAVIEAAIRDTMLSRERIRQSAIDWLLSDQMDFPEVCQFAGMNADYLRGLMAAKFRRVSS
jgi:hypothetical protein